ncbi:hypothetical protein BN1221_03063 [Brenneria goodwinii]|uniref:Uncharacterized protein n=1 Tax=Brenneria goodwinii TaxID=1109412 RepID=A0A0G4JXD6_9GAMM|nr:hypothetical protein BN1221_03063 [Brenneria goodwinii]
MPANQTEKGRPLRHTVSSIMGAALSADEAALITPSAR